MENRIKAAGFREPEIHVRSPLSTCIYLSAIKPVFPLILQYSSLSKKISSSFIYEKIAAVCDQIYPAPYTPRHKDILDQIHTVKGLPGIILYMGNDIQPGKSQPLKLIAKVRV